MEKREYEVTWLINQDADSPRAAAQKVHDEYMDAAKLGSATCFEVRDVKTGARWNIDLSEETT